MKIRNFISHCLLISSLSFLLIGCSQMTETSMTSEGLSSSSVLGLQSSQSEHPKRKLVLISSEEAVDSVQQELSVKGATISHRYHVIPAIAVSLPDQASERALEALLNNAVVVAIEDDHTATTFKKPDNPGNGNGGNDGGDGTPPSQQTPWGISRVGGSGDGSGKTAWVIDTGVDLDHPDLTVDTSRSTTFISRGKDSKNADDGNGHGTHVAGTIAALDNDRNVIGVAAGASVVAVKVLNSQGSGSYSEVIAGVDYVAANGQAGDVANMSLGGPVSSILDAAVLAASNTGVIFVLAAGNESDDANNSSPARVNGANVYTVSAFDDSDHFAYFSNYGNPPIDYAGPGVDILSLWKNGGENTISGTSMAAPHVAGLLLLGASTVDGSVIGDPDGTADPILALP